MKFKQLLIACVLCVSLTNETMCARSKKGTRKECSEPELVRAEKEISLEIRIDNPDLLVPFTVLKKHQGNVVAAAKDSKLVRNKSKVRKAYKEVRERVTYFKKVVNDFSSALKNTRFLEEELKDPHYAPLLENISPCAQDTLAALKDLLAKTASLADKLESEIENNKALKALLGQSHNAKKDTTKKC